MKTKTIKWEKESFINKTNWKIAAEEFRHVKIMAKQHTQEEDWLDIERDKFLSGFPHINPDFFVNRDEVWAKRIKGL